MKTFKIGIIGLSKRSGMIQSFSSDNVKIIAAADLDRKALDTFQGKAGKNIFLTEDYNALLKRKDLDAVFIMTRDYQHEDIAVAALNAGKAVYLEKPMAITIEGCDRILNAAYENRTKLFLGHNMRYMPFVLKMKEIIDSGIIGDIQAVWCRHFIGYGNCYFRSWCSEQAHTNGLLLQKGAHDIDIIHWLAGGYTDRVIGMGKLSVYDKCGRRKANEAPDRDKAWKETCWPPLSQNDLAPHIDIEDHNMLMLSLDNGVHASYTQCFYTPDSERNYTFIGTRGRVENVGDKGDCEIHVWTQRGSRSNPDIIHKLKAISGGHGGSDPAIITAFINFVRDGILPNTSPIAARNAVAAGVLGHLSMRNGNAPKDIPSLPSKIIKYFDNGQIK
ncbi:MAG: Oxidoreductase family, NAD-binding Rossmann fold protein [Candidatus Uhrbacteria bacterium GW2011_GWF2_39_13]|uniref:Oxidoreductase family, NAD-binding Rossmann fold protein n=1 Tax=Candidatus Uhrbacteria bacterium GW2011_GWF2_39_13 TaxID=1618995 RepID=A0A0G0MNN5_9BACT|nr:MAG: Oxidoreductase family, NAD-binding Rossmann fold protein [Candidatus Uhrbacteria bacterium GW2011_GWF2_39_13]